MSSGEERYFQERARIEQGHTKYRDKLREEGKLFVRDRLKLLLDPGSECLHQAQYRRRVRGFRHWWPPLACSVPWEPQPF